MVAVAFASLTTIASAVVLDWDAVTWTPGSLTNSYNLDASAGNDIRLTVTDPNSRRVPDPVTNVQSPLINNTLAGGYSGVGAAPNSLKFAVDFGQAGETITIKIDFLGVYALGVQGVSFTLFDLDAEPADYVDQVISISATDGVSTFWPTITNGSAVTLTGSQLSQTLTGNTASPDGGAGSANGNATIDFGSTAVTSVTFSFAAGAAGRNNPFTQTFAMGDISFTPVPEVNPAWVGAGVCVVATLAFLRQRRRALRG